MKRFTKATSSLLVAFFYRWTALDRWTALNRSLGRQTAPLSLAAFLCWAAPLSAGEVNTQAGSEPQATELVYFALADEHGAPTRKAQTSFDCTDKIFTVLEVQNYKPREYQLSVKWIDPSGRQREHTQYPFHVHGQHEHRLWAWLSLSRATGAGMLTFINPAAGLEEFIGEWTIEVRVNGKLLDTSKMAVVC